MSVGCSSGYTPLTWVSKVWKVSSGHSPQGALGLNSVHPGFETSFFQLLSLREPVGERIGPGFQVQICTPPMDVGSTPGFFSCPGAGQPARQGAAGLCMACPSGVVSLSQGHLVSTLNSPVPCKKTDSYVPGLRTWSALGPSCRQSHHPLKLFVSLLPVFESTVRSVPSCTCIFHLAS